MTMMELIEKLRTDKKAEPGCYGVLSEAFKRFEEYQEMSEIVHGRDFLSASKLRDAEYQFIYGMLWGLMASKYINELEFQSLMEEM